MSKSAKRPARPERRGKQLPQLLPQGKRRILPEHNVPDLPDNNGAENPAQSRLYSAFPVEVIELDRLIPAPYNPRKITDKALEGLAASLRRFGVVEPIIWNKQTGYVVGGHQRLKVLKKEGLKAAQVIVVDLSPEDEIELNVTLNNQKTMGAFANEDLAGLLMQIEQRNPDYYVAGLLADLFKTINLPPEPGDLPQSFAPSSRFVVIVECDSEVHQLELIERFTEQGLKCKAVSA